MFKYLLFFIGIYSSHLGYSQNQKVTLEVNPALVKEKQLAVHKAEQSQDKVKIKEAKVNLLKYQISHLEIGSKEYNEKENELKEVQQKNKTKNAVDEINNAPKEQRRKVIR